MTKEAFLEALGEKLSFLPREDAEERLAFYSETIDRRMEKGMAEEDAVAAAGPVSEAAAQVLSEIPLPALMRKNNLKKEKRQGRKTALLILCAPVWLPPAIAAAAVLLSLYITLWALVACVYAAGAGFAAGGLAGFLYALQSCFPAGKTAQGIFMLGAGLALAGLAVLTILLGIRMTKAAAGLMKKTVFRIKAMIAGKEA